MAKQQAAYRAMHRASPNQLCRYCGSIPALRQCLAYGKMCASCGKLGHFKKVCQSRKDHAAHEVEVDVSQEECKIGEVSINLVYLNNK